MYIGENRMNINASIIDQRLSAVSASIAQRAQDELSITDPIRLKSLAFVHLSVQTLLDISPDEAFDCLTEGTQDFGVDAMQISEEFDGEFVVTLFQGKYKQKNLDGNSTFPESGVSSLIRAIQVLFDPQAQLQPVNPRLLSRVEEVRSLIRDGYIPQVRAVLCNNGLHWNEAADILIKQAGFNNQVTWEYLNHDRLVSILQSTKPINDTLHLTGSAIIEDFNFSRVFIGRIHIKGIYSLMHRHGERLLDRNIRRYLGLQGNRVNEAIRDTLLSKESNNFYFYNNGITLVCEKFDYNALQRGDYQVNVENLQIINGGQTCMTIYKTLKDHIFEPPSDAYILLRLYQLPRDNDHLIRQITYATNSQNPVDLKDLRANDDLQKRLEVDIEQLGYSYRRKRTDSTIKPVDITSGVAAEAVLSVWRQKPHQAKFFSREHFGKLYDHIFSEDLTGAQVIIATLIYRITENRRKRPKDNDPPFIRYASCFLAMQMGHYLLEDMKLVRADLGHVHLNEAEKLIRERGDYYLERAIVAIDSALHKLYGTREVSLQQLAATFRRGDLIEQLLE